MMHQQLYLMMFSLFLDDAVLQGLLQRQPETDLHQNYLEFSFLSKYIAVHCTSPEARDKDHHQSTLHQSDGPQA